jgi:hypothetical protein
MAEGDVFRRILEDLAVGMPVGWLLEEAKAPLERRKHSGPRPSESRKRTAP